MDDPRLETVMPLLLFPLLWVVVSFVIGYISGWRDLAVVYRAGQPLKASAGGFSRPACAGG
jgi:hypothetical protein